MPLRSPRLLLIPAAILATLVVGVGPAAAPPMGPRADVPPAAYAYEKLRAHGTPIAMILGPTALRATPGGRRLAVLGRVTQWRSPRVLPALSRRGGWLKVLATELPNGDTAWVRMASVRLLPNPWSVVADLSSRHVTVRRNGRVVRRFTVAVGAPATPTPTGRFAVTDKLRLTGGSAAYGCCALALSGHQPNLKQGWSGGDRLAVHGTTELRTLGQAASLGCLRARDGDARWIVQNVLLGTVVEIRP
jgi:lipoprotein-anchoring transpeptidase ErfK/SrfK